MKNRNLLVTAILAAALAGSPMRAADFALMGSYWNTDAAGDAAGGGISLGLPINDTFGFELRATYFEELTDDPFRNAFDSDDPVFQDQGIQVLPLDAGVRLTFAPGGWARPYVGGGVSYFLLDSDFGEIADELGYYAVVGATLGDGEGTDFFVEGLWRKATAQVEIDPERLDDIDDLDVESRADVDLEGLGVNLGFRWHF
jgi:opacity protein-like surface antigen